jgi:hypothetical protein
MALGKISTWVEESYRTFQEETANALDGKEFQLVEPGTADNTVKLNTGAGNAIGVMFEKLQPTTGRISDITVRMLGKEGTVKMIQAAAIGYGKKVVADSGDPTRVKELPTAAGAYRVIGRKVSQGGGAAGDVIEVDDAIETVLVVSTDSLTALTFSATATGAEVAALRDAVKAILEAHTIMA